MTRRALLILAILAACGDGDQPEVDYSNVVAFDTTRVTIVTAADTILVRAEVADTQEKRSHGLMERTALAEDAGMIFLFDEDQGARSGFYMFRTRIPLDIAYADAGGTIVGIQTMQPCEIPNPALCPTYHPGKPYRAALEVNAGYFQQKGIKVGDRIVVTRE